MDQGVLSWFEHVKRMDEYRMVEGYVWMTEVRGESVRGNLRFDWMDGVKVA